MAASGYAEIDHTADWALSVQGIDLPDLLAQACAGMLSLAGASPLPRAPSRPRTLRIKAEDRETLLVRWLEEVLYLAESESLMPAEMRLRIGAGPQLVARLRLSPIASRTRAIKAVTFHDLRVVERHDGLQTTVVFDV